MTASPTTTPARRRRRTGSRAALAVATVLALGLGACSASGGEAATPQDAPATTAPAPPDTTADPVDPVDPEPPVSTPPTTEAPDPGGDLAEIEERLAAINLTLDDLPAGWTSEPPVEESTTVVAECAPHGGDDHVLASVPSDRFSMLADGGGGLGLDTASAYIADEDTAAQLLSEIGTSDFAACASEQLMAGGEGVSIEGALTPVDGGLDLGDGAAALQGDFVLSDTTGQTAQLSVIVVAIRTDQVITAVTALAYDTPGDEQLLYGVFDTIAERQAAA